MRTAIAEAAKITQRTEPVNGYHSVPAGILVRVRVNQSWLKRGSGENADKPIIMVLDDRINPAKVCYVQEVIFCGPAKTVAGISETETEYDRVLCAEVGKRHACMESDLGARYR